MEVRYRAARPDDLPACLDVFLEAAGDLRARQNMPPLAPLPDERRLVVHRHVLSTGIFHVAEAEGRIHGFACAIVRDHLWFLAGLWVRPGWQRQHIGMTLLRRVWDAGKQAGAATFFVWSSSDPPALAAYMRMGMLPGCQILEFEGPSHPAAVSPAGYVVKDLDPSFAIGLDRIVLGTGRKVDHNQLVQAQWQPRQVLLGRESVGYFYMKEGHVGPMAWTEAPHAVPVLTLACNEAATTGPNLTLFVPGMNHTALRFAFSAGFRLTGFSHLLTTAPFGRLDQYCPSGPALF